MFTNYIDICHFLDKLGLFHMDLSLNRISKALHDLDLTSPSFTVVQVVGTNGKGSTSTFLQSLARAHGLRTGLFTSPHFVSPSERIHVNGLPLPEEAWPALANAVHNKAPSLTYFEFLTVLSFLAFSEAKVDIAIMEAGLGGHYDATTALTRHALCISPISLDHESVLGDTVLAIAKDKAHAMAENMPVFVGAQQEPVYALLKDFAKMRKARFYPLHKDCIPPSTRLGLYGSHQQDNAALALSAWQWLAQENSWPCHSAAIDEGLATAFIAGRLQSIETQKEHLPAKLLLDGAHNAHSLEVLREYVQNLDMKPAAIIFSCLADKDMGRMLPILKKIHAECAYCPLYLTDIQNNARALTPENKASLAKELGPATQLTDTLSTSLTLAHASAAQGPVLICGSLYLLGEFFEKYPHYLTQTRGI